MVGVVKNASAMEKTPINGVEADIFKLVFAGATSEQWAEWLRAPLEHAAAVGNYDLFTKLVEAGANCSAGWMGCGGRTLLDAAAFGGNAEVVSTVLHKGSRSDINVLATHSKRSALYAAVAGGHDAAARKLILAGADVNYWDPSDKRPPLVAAVEGGRVAMVIDLLLAGASPCAWRDDIDGNTVLHIAAETGHREIVTALLGANFDVDISNAHGRTPLMLASENDRLAVVNALLAAGADVGVREALNKELVLHLAAHRGRKNTIRAILRHGADLDARCSQGFTALHDAVANNQAGAVDVLLDAGADVNFTTKDGETALHLAVRDMGRSDALIALLRRRSCLHQADKFGNTALHTAISSRQPSLDARVDLLLRWGASETAVNRAYQTPLQLLETRLNRLQASTKDWHERERAELISARELLTRAPADRTWRRRCLLVMLRAREHGRGEFVPFPSRACYRVAKEDKAMRGREGHGISELRNFSRTIIRTTSNHHDNNGEGCLRDIGGIGAGASGGGETEKEAEAAVEISLHGLVAAVVEQMPAAVFREIVMFL